MRVQVEWMPLKKKKLPQYCGSFFMSCRNVEKAPPNRYDT